MRKIFVILALASFCAAYGQDRLFTYTYQSGVLNKGQKELEVWSTMHNGRTNYYRGFDHRLEFETGLGGNLQTAFYLNYGYSTGIEENNGVQSLNNSSEFSFSNEWKYKMSDPVANALGSALYFEYTLSPTDAELEGKLILDKQIGKTTHAFNLVGEYEFSKEFNNLGNKITTTSQRELKVELNYAFAYKIKDGLSAGLEVFNENQFSRSSKWENSILSLGPCVSYSTNGFWVNLTVLPQITNLKGGGLDLIEHEKLQTRLAFSFAI
jgi:hypothetical protein